MRAAAGPRILLGRYRLDSLVGEGGMGSVHRATDLRLQREVAVKVVHQQANGAEARARFVLEAQRTAQVRHPNVVEVFDVGEGEAGELFFVMELLQGEPLSALLARKGRLSPSDFVRIAREMCDGLGAAHAMGVIHRDVKPPNVMLVRRGRREDFVKWVDFGIAKAEQSSTQLTEAGMFLGTLEYIAPEQILGETALDARADVYALGAVFYRMLSGVRVFVEVPRTALIHHHVSVDPRPPSACAPDADIPPALEALVMRCLAKAPSTRPANAAALRDELDAVVRAIPSLRAAELEGPLASAPAAVPTRPQARPLQPVAVTEPMRRPGIMTFEPAASGEPPASLELMEPARGTVAMARPVAQTCVDCGRVIPPAAYTCPGCGAGRASPGTISRPVGPRPAGPPAWLVPLGMLPVWLSVTLAGLSAAAGVGLALAGLDSKAAYWGLVVLFVLATLGALVRRALDASRA